MSKKYPYDFAGKNQSGHHARVEASRHEHWQRIKVQRDASRDDQSRGEDSVVANDHGSASNAGIIWVCGALILLVGVGAGYLFGKSKAKRNVASR